MKASLIFLLCFLPCCAAFSRTPGPDSVRDQKKFSSYLKVSHGTFYVPQWVSFYKTYSNHQGWFNDVVINNDNGRRIQFETIAATYERRAYKNWFLGASFQQWKDLFHFRGSRNLFSISSGTRFLPVGEVGTRISYKMLDVYTFYKGNIGHWQHFINVGTGLTYAWGRDDYVTASWINPDPPYDGVVYYGARKAHYWGITPYLAYDFLFLHNRINIGPDIRLRYYINRPPAEYYFNFHLGVNF
jgi:hypothetical protein